MQMQNELDVGDEVITTAGIYGTITEIDDDYEIITLEVAPNTEMRFSRGAVAQRLLDDDEMDNEDEVEGAEPGSATRSSLGRSGRTRRGRPYTGRAGSADARGAGPDTYRADPAGAEQSTVTLEDVQDNDEPSLFIASADRVMDARGTPSTVSGTPTSSRASRSRS